MDTKGEQLTSIEPVRKSTKLMSEFFGLPDRIGQFTDKLPDLLNDLAKKAMEKHDNMMEGAFNELQIGLGLIGIQVDKMYVKFATELIGRVMMGGPLNKERTEQALMGGMRLINLTVKQRFNSLDPKPADNEEMYRRQLCVEAGLNAFDIAKSKQDVLYTNWYCDFGRSILAGGGENRPAARSLASQIEREYMMKRSDEAKIVSLKEQYINLGS